VKINAALIGLDLYYIWKDQHGYLLVYFIYVCFRYKYSSLSKKEVLFVERRFIVDSKVKIKMVPFF